MAKISGGSNSFLLRSLVQAIVDTKAIPGGKVGEVIERFKSLVNETETAKRNPAEVLRHVGAILAQLYPLGPGAIVPAVNLNRVQEDFEAYHAGYLPPNSSTVSPVGAVSDVSFTAPENEVVIDADLTIKFDKCTYVLEGPKGNKLAEVQAHSGTDAIAQGHARGWCDLKAYAKAESSAEDVLKAAAMSLPTRVNLALDPADIDLLLEDVDASMPPYPRSALQVALEAVVERFAAAPRHPFIEKLVHDGKRYIVVGTATLRSTKKEGVSRSANCTVKNYRRIKDADEAILAHVDGRPMSATRELDNGVCFVWLLHHVPGLVVRFWLNESDNGVRKDNPKGTYRITLSQDEPGWKRAA